jgi:hypothetical protein
MKQKYVVLLIALFFVSLSAAQGPPGGNGPPDDSGGPPDDSGSPPDNSGGPPSFVESQRGGADIITFNEEVLSTEFTSDGVRFYNNRTDKTVPYKDVFIPEDYQEHLNGFSASYSSPGNSPVSKLSIDFSFNVVQTSSELPRVLDGYSYQLDTLSNPAQTKYSIQSSMDISDNGNGTSMEEDADYDVKFKNDGKLIQKDGSLNRKVNGSQVLNDASISGSAGSETLAFDLGLINTKASTYNENLVIDYDVHSSVRQPREADPSLSNETRHRRYGKQIIKTTDYFPGSEPNVTTITNPETSIITDSGDTYQQISAEYDNKYDDSKNITVIIANPEESTLASTFIEGNEQEASTSLYEEVKARFAENNLPQEKLIQDESEYNFHAYNVSAQENTKVDIQARINPSGDIISRSSYIFILGSVGSMETSLSSSTDFSTGTESNMYINPSNEVELISSSQTESWEDGDYTNDPSWFVSRDTDGGSNYWQVSQNNPRTGSYHLLHTNQQGLFEDESLSLNLPSVPGKYTIHAIANEKARPFYFIYDSGGDSIGVNNRKGEKAGDQTVGCSSSVTHNTHLSKSNYNKLVIDVSFSGQSTVTAYDPSGTQIFSRDVGTCIDDVDRVLLNSKNEHGDNTLFDDFSRPAGYTQGSFVSKKYNKTGLKSYDNVTIESTFTASDSNVDLQFRTFYRNGTLKNQKLLDLTTNGVQTFDLNMEGYLTQFKYNGSVATEGDSFSLNSIDWNYDIIPPTTIDSKNKFSKGVTDDTVVTDSGLIELAAKGSVKTGTVTGDSGNWKTINYPEMANPVVVGTIENTDSNKGLIFEARNVGATSAEVRVCDSDGRGSCESSTGHPIHYLAVDANAVNPVDGIEAGTFSTSGEFTGTPNTITYSENFGNTPIPLLSTQTVNGVSGIEGRLSNIDSTSFTGGICQQDSNDECNSGHTTETVGWVALEPGNNPFPDAEVGQSGSIGSSNSDTVSFSDSFSQAPVPQVVGITENGGQELQVDQVSNIGTGSMTVGYCELESNDDCDGHTGETMGWFALEAGKYGIGQAVNFKGSGSYASEKLAFNKQYSFSKLEIDAAVPTSTSLEAKFRAIKDDGTVAGTDTVQIQDGLNNYSINVPKAGNGQIFFNGSTTDSSKTFSVDSIKLIRSTPPSIDLGDPPDNSRRENPINFDFTPECFTENGCESATLYLAENNVFSTDSNVEWNKGSFTDAKAVNGKLQLGGIARFFDGFEHSGASDGAGIVDNSEWVQVASDMEYDTGQVSSGSYSAFSSNNPSSPFMYREFSSTDKKVDWVAIDYRESSSSYGGGYSFRDQSGNRILGWATDNPNIGIYDGNGNWYPDDCGTSYNTWYTVNVTFNWQQDTFGYTTSNGCSNSGFPLGGASGISRVYIENHNQEFWGSGQYYQWTDNLEVGLGNSAQGSYQSKTFSATEETEWSSSTSTSTPSGTSLDIDYGTNKSGVWNYYDTASELPLTQHVRFNTSLSTSGSNIPKVDFIDLNAGTATWSPVKSITNVQDDTQNTIGYNTRQFASGKLNLLDWNIEVEDSQGNKAFNGTNKTVEAFNPLELEILNPLEGETLQGTTINGKFNVTCPAGCLNGTARIKDNVSTGTQLGSSITTKVDGTYVQDKTFNHGGFEFYPNNKLKGMRVKVHKDSCNGGQLAIIDETGALVDKVTDATTGQFYQLNGTMNVGTSYAVGYKISGSCDSADAGATSHTISSTDFDLRDSVAGWNIGDPESNWGTPGWMFNIKEAEAVLQTEGKEVQTVYDKTFNDLSEGINSFDQTVSSNGDYLFNVTIYDQDGSRKTRENRFNVDSSSSPPSIDSVLVEPRPAPVSTGFTVRANVTDSDSNLDNVELNLTTPADNVALSSTQMNNDASIPKQFSFSYNPSEFSDRIGQWSGKITATDTNGNTNISDITFNVYDDVDPQVTNVRDSVSGKVKEGRLITITADVFDGQSSIEEAKLLENSSGSFQNTSTKSVSIGAGVDDSVSFNFDENNFDDVLGYSIYVRDAAGNWERGPIASRNYYSTLNEGNIQSTSVSGNDVTANNILSRSVLDQSSIVGTTDLNLAAIQDFVGQVELVNVLGSDLINVQTDQVSNPKVTQGVNDNVSIRDEEIEDVGVLTGSDSILSIARSGVAGPGVGSVTGSVLGLDDSGSAALGVGSATGSVLGLDDSGVEAPFISDSARGNVSVLSEASDGVDALSALTGNLDLDRSGDATTSVSGSVNDNVSIVSVVSDDVIGSTGVSSLLLVDKSLTAIISGSSEASSSANILQDNNQDINVDGTVDDNSVISQIFSGDLQLVGSSSTVLDLVRDTSDAALLSGDLGDETLVLSRTSAEDTSVDNAGVFDSINISTSNQQISSTSDASTLLDIPFSRSQIVGAVGQQGIVVDLARSPAQSSTFTGEADADGTFTREDLQSISASPLAGDVIDLARATEDVLGVSGTKSRSTTLERSRLALINNDPVVDRDLLTSDEAEQVSSISSQSSESININRQGQDIIEPEGDVDRGIVLARALIEAPSVLNNADRGLTTFRGLSETASVVDQSVNNLDIDFNPFQIIGLQTNTTNNTAPRIENVTVHIKNVGRNREVFVEADVQDIDGSDDREKLILGDKEKEITGGMGRTIRIDLHEGTSANKVLTAVDDQGAETDFLIDYNYTDNVYSQNMNKENNLDAQYINISNEVSAGSLMGDLTINLSHATYGAVNMSDHYAVKTLSEKGDVLNLSTMLKGDFLPDSLQWHTRKDRYNTMDNQSIAATVNVSNRIDYLTFDVATGSVESPDPFGSCSGCGSKDISVPPSGFGSTQLFTDTGDGVNNELEQDIEDVVLGQREEYWEQYRYNNITSEVRFRDIWVNVTLDENESEFTRPFVRVRSNNTYNNTVIPSTYDSCSTGATDIDTFVQNNETWKTCAQDLDDSGKPEFIKLQIPSFSEYNVRFGLGEQPAESFAYVESSPCPDALEGERVGTNESYVCHQNLVMEPSRAQLQQQDVSTELGRGISGIFYIVIILAAVVVLFYSSKSNRDELDDWQPF